MRRCLAVLSVSIALWAAACGDDYEPPVGQIDYEVLRYDYRFDLDSRAAASDVTFRVTTPGDCLDLPFRAVDPSTEVLFDGEPALSGTIADGVAHLCGPGWETDTEVVVSMAMTVPLETWGDSDVGYSVLEDIEGNPFSYMVGWVGGCDRFGPCDRRTDRFAHYAFTVTHPSGTTVLCPGTVTAGDTETTCEFTFDGGPTYSTFGVVASPSWEVTDLGDWGGVRVTLYDMPTAGIADEFDTARHAAFLEFMAERFGPFPYGDELRFATGPTYWNGFEHPGNIVLYDGLTNGISRRTPLAHVVDHELVHQWAGDQTTLATTYDFVWKEAMAEYLSFVFEDSELGNPSTARGWKTFAGLAEWYPVPEEQPPLLDYYGHVYDPGPMILFRQLEVMFSRDQVMDALASVLGDESTLSVEGVRAALEASTGADLQNYFDTWVYGEGEPVHPEFAVDVADNGDGTYDVTVTQQVPDPAEQLMGCAFHIQLTGDGGETHDVFFDLGPDGLAEQTVTADPGFAVTGHDFDPHAESLASEVGQAAAAAPRAWSHPWESGRVRRPYRH